MLLNIEEEFNPEEIDFELFCRLVAIYIELANSNDVQPDDQIPEESQGGNEENDYDDSQNYE